MKSLKNVLVCASILAVAAAQGATPPLARLSVRSYADLTNAISRLAASVSPDKAGNAVAELNEALGLTNLAALDARRPWEIAVWYGGGAEQPLVALKAPVADVAKFKENLSAEGVLRTEGHEWAQLSNSLSLVVFRGAEALSDAEKSALEEWKATALKPPARLVELTLSMSESFRTQAAAGMAFGKMMLGQAMAAQNSQAEGGVNPAAMQAMLGAYFDILDTVVGGLQELGLGLDLSSDALTVESSVAAKPGSELATWLQKPAGQVTAEDMKWVEPEAFFSMAGYIGKEPWLLKLTRKLTRAAFQVQNLDTNSAALKDLDDLLAKTLPASLAGWMDLKDKFTFAFAYRFPASNPTAAYAEMKHFLTNGFQAFVGKDKPYSAGSLAERDHTLAGVLVDRFSLTVNLDSPLFKMPGQREQIQALWPEGKMVMDYALKEDRLLVASPDRMKDLLEPPNAKSGPKATLKLEAGTLAAGYLNLPRILRQAMAANPAIPDAVKEKMAKLDGRGTGIEFQIRVDGRVHSIAKLPLKLFQVLGQLGDN